MTLPQFLNWHTMLVTGGPVVVGSATLGLPVAALIYYLMFRRGSGA